jgi:hypothetical protein
VKNRLTVLQVEWQPIARRYLCDDALDRFLADKLDQLERDLVDGRDNWLFVLAKDLGKRPTGLAGEGDDLGVFFSGVDGCHNLAFSIAMTGLTNDGIAVCDLICQGKIALEKENFIAGVMLDET